MTAPLDATLAHIDRDLETSLQRLLALLRIPSISTDPAFRSQCRTAADWLVRELRGLGFDASVRPTAGHPMVVARGRGRASGPHVLFYGHYDVQPPDPLDLWESPPFEPRVVAGADGVRCIVGGGSGGGKGPPLQVVEAGRGHGA